MAPFFVLALGTLLFRGAGAVGVTALAEWRRATLLGLVAMFLFTGATHFTDMKHDYAAMVPPPLTGQLWVIYGTGVLEVAGAVGLLVSRTRRWAGACLFLLLLGLFPANAYAALNGVEFRGTAPTNVWVRGGIQLLFLAAVWWSAIRWPDLKARRRAVFGNRLGLSPALIHVELNQCARVRRSSPIFPSFDNWV